MTNDHSDKRALPAKAAQVQSVTSWERLLAAGMGGLLGLALLKFGNPVIFDRLVERPRDFWEIAFQPWPVGWGYGLLACLALLSLRIAEFRYFGPRWIVFLPLVWLFWQGIATANTVDAGLSHATLRHFGACVLCFYLGLFAISQVRCVWWFWGPPLAAFVLVLWFGFEQHYGGLEAARKYFYEQPNWQQFPPDYLKKIASDRIFSTLVYPNALAGAIILFLPIMLAVVWHTTLHLPTLLRRVLLGILAYLALACLYWSGSKAGWLIVLAAGAVVLFRYPLPFRIKVGVAVTLCGLGLAAFFVRFAPYFQKGATSVGARFEYWTAALTTAKQHSVLGTGPGTFAISFAKIKPPDAEMARLVHNDYLEQASDSGVIGFLTYSVFVIGSICFLYRKCKALGTDLTFPVWLGLLGWTLQGFVEFSLYIPALAWPAFTCLGWLHGTRHRDEIKSTAVD